MTFRAIQIEMPRNYYHICDFFWLMLFLCFYMREVFFFIHFFVFCFQLFSPIWHVDMRILLLFDIFVDSFNAVRFMLNVEYTKRHRTHFLSLSHTHTIPFSHWHTLQCEARTVLFKSHSIYFKRNRSDVLNFWLISFSLQTNYAAPL